MSSDPAIKINKGKSLVRAVAFDLLKDAEQDYKTNGKFSDDTLQTLHSVFGDTLVRATELLENRKVFVYHLKDFSRKLIKLTGKREQHVLFCDINYCQCDSFVNGVVEGKIVACEHVLAVKLAEACGNVNNIVVSDTQMKDMLNDVMS